MVTQRQYDCFEKIQEYLATQQFARNITDISKHTDISRPTVDSIVKGREFGLMFEQIGNGYKNKAVEPAAQPIGVKGVSPVEEIIASKPTSKAKVIEKQKYYAIKKVTASTWHMRIKYTILKLINPEYNVHLLNGYFTGDPAKKPEPEVLNPLLKKLDDHWDQLLDSMHIRTSDEELDKMNQLVGIAILLREIAAGEK